MCNTNETVGSREKALNLISKRRNLKVGDKVLLGCYGFPSDGLEELIITYVTENDGWYISTEFGLSFEVSFGMQMLEKGEVARYTLLPYSEEKWNDFNNRSQEEKLRKKAIGEIRRTDFSQLPTEVILEALSLLQEADKAVN